MACVSQAPLSSKVDRALAVAAQGDPGQATGGIIAGISADRLCQIRRGVRGCSRGLGGVRNKQLFHAEAARNRTAGGVMRRVTHNVSTRGGGFGEKNFFQGSASDKHRWQCEFGAAGGAAALLTIIFQLK